MAITKLGRSAAAVLAALAAVTAGAEACTSLVLTTKSGGQVYGRTM
jgi:penicillin V acylase-like amidase (Ntn superfamily)